MMARPMLARLAMVAALALAALGCESELETPPEPFTDLLVPTPGAYGATTLFRTVVVDQVVEGSIDSSYAFVVDDALTLIDTAEWGLEVMLENLYDQQVAEAIVAAAERGVEVRIVGDVDRREQRGFALLEEAGLTPIYGDGSILWNGVFGEDPILRTGEDNQFTHNVIIADRLRMLALTAGFPEGRGEVVQSGFAAVSEVLARDFGNIFDQLHGGVFATTLTYYDQPVPSDGNNRTLYPTEEGAIEVYFGPQEPLVKELVDRIYMARASVWLAAPVMLNSEVARALIYKAQVGFDVQVVVGTVEGTRDGAELLPEVLARFAAAGSDRSSWVAPEYRINPALIGGGTLIVIDGKRAFDGDDVQPGVVLSMTAPLFESVPYYIENVRVDGLDLSAQPSDRFTDAHLWAVHGVPDDGADYLRLRAQFERVYETGTLYTGPEPEGEE